LDRGQKFVMHLRRVHYDLMRAGDKKTEIRLAYPDRLALQPGDTIRFGTDDEPQSVETRVTQVIRYPSLRQLANSENSAAITGPGTTRDDVVSAIVGIYTPRQIERYGLLAIRLAVANPEGAET
jgi:ASC-1-like (ASCH) protein